MINLNSFLFKLPIFIFYFTGIYIVKAQSSIGLLPGITTNFLNTDISYLSNTRIKPDFGVGISVPFQLQIQKQFVLEARPGFNQKNYTLERTGLFTGIYESHYNAYIQVPLVLKYETNGKFKFFVNAGMYAGYWLSGRVKGEIPDIYSVATVTNQPSNQTFNLSYYSEKYQFNKKKDKRYEYGWTSGIGVGHFISSKYKLSIEIDYYQSLTDQQKKYIVNQISNYNQTFSFETGVIKILK